MVTGVLAGKDNIFVTDVLAAEGSNPVNDIVAGLGSTLFYDKDEGMGSAAQDRGEEDEKFEEVLRVEASMV